MTRADSIALFLTSFIAVLLRTVLIPPPPPSLLPLPPQDPNAPKGARAAFIFFSQGTEKDKIKAENPGLSMPELSKLVGQRWREMGEEDKKVRRRDVWQGVEGFGRDGVASCSLMSRALRIFLGRGRRVRNLKAAACTLTPLT